MNRFAAVFLTSFVVSVASTNVLGAPDAGGSTPSPTVTTSGSASIFVVPDEAELRFDIHTFDHELKRAKDLNDDASSDVLGFLKSSGIDVKDVQTAFVTSEAVYETQGGSLLSSSSRRLTGYTVNRSYGIKVRDLAKLGAIYDKLLPDTRITLGGLTLSSSHSRETRDEARRNAAKAAREKAEELAATLDAKLGCVRTIVEESARPFYQSGFSNFAREQPGGDAGSESATPIGQIEIKADVSVTFDLSPAAAK